MSDTEESSASAAHRNARLIFNIGGQRHETFVNTLKAVPGTRLSWIADNYLLLQHSPAYDPVHNEFFFDRNPTCFAAIVNYFRTGQLHYPTNVCGPVFQCELKFWGIDEAQMESCCWELFTRNRDKDAKLKGFKGPLFLGESEDNEDAHGKENKWRMKLWKLLDDAYSSKAARINSYIGYVILFFYIMVPIADSMTTVRELGESSENTLFVFELILNAYFTLELFLRFILCPQKKEFLTDRMNFADLISLIPAYINLVSTNKKILSYFDILKVFRIVKVFRSFRYNYTLQVLVNTLKESLPELLLLLFLMSLLATVFAYASFFVEGQKEGTLFKSIPHCLWWAFITMTTVGYGDMTPESWLGQIIGIMCAVCGLLMVALPVSVVATNFSIYYSYAKARISLPPKKKVKAAADANTFLGQNTMKEDSSSKGKNKVSPMTNGMAKTSNGAISNGKAHNGNPLGTKGNKLPPLKNDKFQRIRDAVQKMKDQGIIKPKKKMDLAALVMVLSSKGDWSAPE